MNSKPILLLYLLAGLFTEAVIERNYTYLYLENGHTPMLNASRRAITNVHDNAFSDPNIIIQTGYYSVRFNCKTLSLSGFDPLEGTSYLNALTEEVTQFTPTPILLVAYKGNKAFTQSHGIIQDLSTQTQHLRFIEGGQYVQRVDHTNVVLRAADGEELTGRLEITAWPTHLIFTLDFSHNTDVTRTTVKIITPDQTSHITDRFQPKASLGIRPHHQLTEPRVSPFLSLVTATDWNNTPLVKSWDDELQSLRLDLPTEWFRQSDSKDTVHEYTFRVTNITNEDKSVPIRFYPDEARAVTGTVMMLCHKDGRPTGIPVQVSKNWHGTAGNSAHEGQWLRGYTMIPLAAGESREFKLKIIYGYWGNGSFGTVSHSSLSLIGWADHTNWKWDQAALGAWGETLTTDITQHAAGSLFADVRPTFTTPFNSEIDHSWTENVGGGDMLNYTDSNGLYQPFKKLKTCYLKTGPNMTETWYSGVTTDEKIRFKYQMKSNGSTDYFRRYTNYWYEFLEDVQAPERMCFYQNAADNYFNTNFQSLYVGNHDGTLAHYPISSTGGDLYLDAKIPFDNSWMGILDDTAFSGNKTHCSRGILNHGATLNGAPYPLYIHPYNRTLGQDTKLFDVAGDTPTESYQQGDIITGGFTLFLPANDGNEYWGSDTEFATRLAYKPTWQIIQDEHVHNEALDLTMQNGVLRSLYPLTIEAQHGGVLAQFTINTGGLGHLPVTLINVDTGKKLKAQRLLNNQWVDLEGVNINDHDYYQGFLNEQNLIDYTFSIKRPTNNLQEAWTVRILGEGLPYKEWLESAPLYTDSTLKSAHQDYWLDYILHRSPDQGTPASDPCLFTLNSDTYYLFMRNTLSTNEFTQTWQSSTSLGLWDETGLNNITNPEVIINPLTQNVEQLFIKMDAPSREFSRLKVSE